MSLAESLRFVCNPMPAIEILKNIPGALEFVPPAHEVIETDYVEIESDLSPVRIIPELYQALATYLIDAIGSREFFRGEVEYEGLYFNLKLEATLLIYRDQDGEIIQITPIWWSCFTTRESGNVVNDFRWDEFEKHLL